MAAANTPESPQRPMRQEPHTITSSPCLPSLDDLIGRGQKKSSLRSGSRAAPIPDDAAKTFTSAASLWRSIQADPIVLDSPSRTPPPCTQPSTRMIKIPKTKIEIPPGSPASQDICDQPKMPSESDERPTNTIEIIALEESPAPEDKSWKKLKAGKDTSEAQGTLPRGKVTKPRAKRATERKRPETASKHFAEIIEQPKARAPRVLSKDESVELEPALKRRTNWTPPPDDTNRALTTDSSPIRELLSSQDGAIETRPVKKVFKSLQENFGCKLSEGLTAGASAMDTSRQASRKRTVLEMVASVDKSANTSSPVKAKTPKRKARTITEVATAAYVGLSDTTDASVVEQPKPNRLLNCHPADDGEITFNPGHPASKLRKGSKPVTKAGRTKKTGLKRRNILLSPTSAMRQSSRQDFVFGTSSQLAREESPTFLRDLQMAMKASNQLDDGPFASPVSSDPSLAAGRRKGLWSAGSRGTDGDLINIEVIDLVDSPAFSADRKVDAFAHVSNGSKSQQTTAAYHVNIGSADLELAERGVSPSVLANQKTSVFSTQTISSDCMATSMPTRDTNERGLPEVIVDEPPPSNQEAGQVPQSTSATSAEAPEMPRPKYELFTDAQLAREVSTYGFRAIKKRSAMIALLDQCWSSKNRTGPGTSMQASTISTTAAASQPRGRHADAAPKSSMAPPPRPRGRPRKESPLVVATPAEPERPIKRPRGRPKMSVETIADPAVAPKPSVATSSMPLPTAPAASETTPTRRKKAGIKRAEIDDSDSDEIITSPEPVFSSPPAVDLSIGDDTEMSLTLSPTTQQSISFGFITKAVTTAPRTTDPAKPSWHERILMYDPIVLEDLAAWLNAGQLDRVGYDNEVSPFEVKKWCDSKSVCCLWRTNLKGKERKRF